MDEETIKTTIGPLFAFDPREMVGDENIDRLADAAAKAIEALVKYAMAEGMASGRMAEVVGNLAMPIALFAEECMAGHPLQEHFQRLPHFLAGQVIGWAFEVGTDEPAADNTLPGGGETSSNLQ